MANKVQWGLSNLYIAPRSVSSSNVVSYGTPVAFPGAKSLTLEVQGNERSQFYADNIVYYASNGTVNGFNGELEVALIPDWFKTQYLGYKTTTEGNLVETDGIGGEFALLLQVEGNDTAKKYCIFNATASRSNREYTSKEESVEPKTETLSLTFIGEMVDNKPAFITECKSTDSNYATFFSSVELPEYATSV